MRYAQQLCVASLSRTRAKNASAVSTDSTGAARARKRLLRTSCCSDASAISVKRALIAGRFAREGAFASAREEGDAISGLESVREDRVVRLLRDARIATGREADVIDGPAGRVLESVARKAEADLERGRAVGRRGELEMVRLPAR